MFTIHNADSLDLLKTLPDNSVHAVVTDPPYGLGDTSPAQVAECLLAWARGETWTPKGSGFMGKSWDAWVPPPELWREMLRVLRPGGHALVFAGTRTQDLMSLSLRLAGFEIRDTMQWLYGSGFPKSHNVSKALDKQAGEQGEVLQTETRYNEPNCHDAVGQGERTLVERVVRAPTTEQAQQWEGWGTALKPAFEPVILARKPLKGTVVQNTLEHGCGGINVDGCRVEWSEGEDSLSTTRPAYTPRHSAVADMNTSGVIYSDPTRQLGRWPANVILDPEAGALLDSQAGEPVSRFFYCAKASRAEREAGLQGHETGSQPRANVHPTVKPINLMRYLVRLVTPPHGTVLDPFTGSGSTGCAAVLERVNFVGIERENEYARIATARINYWATQAQADTPQADAQQAPPTVHKTTRGARRKAPAEDDPQGSLF